MTADVGNLEDLGSRACILATFGRHREAIEVINTALWRYPDDKRLYNNRCCSYIQTFDLENALADAEYLIENYPDFVKGYVRKGEVLTIMKRYSEAEKEYRTALDLVEDESLHVRCLQLQLLQIISYGFDPYSAWKALCETGSVQQSLRLLKTPYRNYEHVVNANFYGETYFKQIEEGSTFSEEEEDDDKDDLGSIESLPDLMKKLEIKMKESAKVEEKAMKDRRQKENVLAGKKIRKKFPNRQDKTKKIIRRNKKKMLFVKCDEKPDNILTVRNK
ncbi:hypothetical protein RUM44_006070 [Polyplax serrata]|uniref:Uncharacterized protein n=1 Tax=Polyplax serrata TaxID=468196 RepID=A0ABR1AYW3_POLSC